MSHTNFNRKSLSLKSQLLQSFLNLGTAHEEFPQQAGTIVLNHRGNGALVDGKIAGHRPVTSLGEGIVESVLAPNPVAFGIEILQCTHGFLRCVGKTGQGCCRCDDTMVVVARAVGCIAFGRVAGGQSPAVLAVTFVLFGILHAVAVVGEGMVAHHVLVVGIAVAQVARVQTDVRVLCPEQGTAQFLGSVVFQFQRQAVGGRVGLDAAAACPAVVVG